METLNMTPKEIDRAGTIRQLMDKRINGTEAAGLLGLSVRHVRRIKAKVIADGPGGLAHGNRGRPGNRKMPEGTLAEMKGLLTEIYADFKPGHACEKLSQVHGIGSNPETVRQVMISEGLWKPRDGGKGKAKHFSWRRRKQAYGEMQQFDGSYEYWLEDRLTDTDGNPMRLCLLASMDDATGRLTKLKFAPNEGVFPVFAFWKEYLESNGAPLSIYMDRFSTYSMNHADAKDNPDTLTQFQRALRELRIDPILAHSPQAKGRVERVFRTLQDRLVREMRLAGISTIDRANEFVEKVFVPWFNSRYAVEPVSAADMHRKLTPKSADSLDGILSRQKERTVGNDFTIGFDRTWYQLTEGQPVTVCKKDRVTVERRLDGTVRIRLRGRYLNHETLPERPKRATGKPWVLEKRKVPKRPNCPRTNHIQRKTLTNNPM